ncbi:MAG: pentapeptide repeat-containing protein [Deltaproteobacteria bacterium]|jgi:uncharacterized protein YjbI with pentapeptide repeats|nr:pentapeptide repeat-containing protein [Deltaproteobacteria bacterium]
MPPKILGHPEAMVGPAFYRRQSQDCLSLSVYLGFSLLESEKVVSLPLALKGAMESLTPYESLGIGLDLGMPKPRGEFLAAAKAFAPYGFEARALTVSLSVGSLRRDFLALGEQRDLGLKPSPPEPFKFQPLDWNRTAHCPEWNPLGLKPGTPLSPEGPALFGPLVTAAEHDRDGRVTQNGWPLYAPVSPLPMNDAPGRLANLGDFDHNWLLNYFPGFPESFNWSFFNVAQKEQRLNSGYFRGDERVQVTNAHSHYPHFDVRLPGYEPRVLYLKDKDPALAYELRPDLDTVWLFPEAALGLLIWRAQMTVKDELASDIDEILVSFEKIGSPAQTPLSIINLARENIWEPLPLATVLAASPYWPKPPEVVDPIVEELEPEIEPLALPGPPPTPPVPAVASLAVAPVMPPTLSPLLDPSLSPESQAAAIMADARKILEEELPSVNAVLKERGLPPQSLKSLESKLRLEEKNLAKAIEINQTLSQKSKILSPTEELTQSLKNLGLPSSKAQSIAQAVELPIPSQGSFQSIAGYNQAMSAYGQKWASLMGFPASAGLAHAEKLKASALLAQNPTSPEALKGLLGFDPAKMGLPTDISGLSLESQPKSEFVNSMKKIGFAPEASSKMYQDITDYEAAMNNSPGFDLADREKLTLEMGQKMEANLNLPAGQMTGPMRENFALTRRTVYGSEDMGFSLNALALSLPALNKYLANIHNIRMEPNLAQKNLMEIGQAAGVSEKELLDGLGRIDPLFVPPPLVLAPPLDPPVQEEEYVEPDWEPTPAQVFLTREQVQATLQDPKIRSLLFWAEIWTGASLSGLDLTDLDFSGLNLSGSDFSGSNLNGASLASANCHGTLFEGALLTGSILAGANLTGAKINGATARDLDFSQGQLTEAEFIEADLTGSNFTGAQADRADFTGTLGAGSFTGASLLGAKFFGSDLTAANFSGALLDGAFFDQVNLSEANFSGCSLNDATFCQVTAPKANFQSIRGEVTRFILKSDLTEANFRGARLRGASFQDTILKGADFTGAWAWGLRADFLSLTAAKLKGAYLRQASFFAADLMRADLSGADLMEATFGSSDLRGANLSGASLYGADLYRIKVDKNTLFYGADLNNTILKNDSLGLQAV